MKNLQLNRLIYGLSNTIIVDLTTPKDILMQIELIKSSMSIDGFIFRPSFATQTELTRYSDEDWRAMFAQYSLTYGWRDRAAFLLGEEPETILENYFNGIGTEFPSTLYTEVKKYEVSDTGFYEKILKDIAESKIVLRQHQIEIIELMPIEFIEKAFNECKFTIKETEILFIKRLISSGSTVFTFTEPDQIVRFLVAVFRSNGEAITGQLNQNILKDVQLKIPTSIRKSILKDIDNMKVIPALRSMHKYKDFWKRIFKQLEWTTQVKMEKRYPNYVFIKDKLYKNEYQKHNTSKEHFKQIGFLEVAFIEEMKNPGQMLRNLFSYLRYPAGSTYASKSLKKQGFNLASAIGLEKSKSVIVREDILHILKTDNFKDALMKANPKLLWQVLGMLEDERWYKPMRSRIVNKKKITYSRELPGLDPVMAKVTKKAIKKAIKKIKKEENISLGKVYIDDTVKNYKIQFSGREDTSISLSGEYLSPGSKIKLFDLIKDKQNPILRVGLAWRGTKSCDIDLSMNVFGHGNVNYQDPVLRSGSEIIMTSSGDITSCGNDIFSTELVDIDIDLCKFNNATKFFNSAIMYSGSTFDQYECYWFMNIIEREDRVLNARKVQINLDEMQYATKLQDPSKAQIGLYFDLEKDEVEVVNIPSVGTRNYNNANSMEGQFIEQLANRPKLTNVAKALKSVIHKDQIVDKEEDANISISASGILPSAITEGVQELIHPGRDQTRLQEILF